MLSVSNLVKYYGQQPVIKELSLQFANKRSCIVGANGSGKTTFLFILAGLIKPDSGQVLWQGKKLISPQSITAIASDAIRNPSFLTVRKLFLLTQSMWQLDFPDKLIAAFGLTPHLDKTLDQLSAGNLKKAHLINAFMRNPRLLLLDEPNIALDENSSMALWQAIDDFSGDIIVASNEPAVFTGKGFNLQGISGD
ncbi:ATP-binding cassette domain-containing protein [Rheinheimera sp. MMS21-TC3]|uniref:ABC transporter ATP-binding protein n=1 Tax=Rheinheimera sp. MMS21-TC3 TaxID=3072790 RepID=UPI0028C509B7|nr:ATP-binding cassette domain-containing protein [Rheinheimera sp. MMS21-TC3]WNO60761.1 ATP-binding cassette domain-containing protein [Rheinheimera sp. MMS21-TC3]